MYIYVPLIFTVACIQQPKINTCQPTSNLWPTVLLSGINDILLDLTPACTLFLIGRNANDSWIVVLLALLHCFYIVMSVIVIVLSVIIIMALKKRKSVKVLTGRSISGTPISISSIIYDIMNGTCHVFFIMYHTSF